MFKRRTLFVVGAGASTEVDLPMGNKLAEQIEKMTDIRFDGGGHVGVGDSALYEQICFREPHNRDAFQKAAWCIHNGIQFAQSIDSFLDRHSDDQFTILYGKTAIVKSIIDAQRKSRLVTREQVAKIFEVAQE